ncbi:MAG: SDR family oxidoreductase [Myxococcales bacterium]
MELNGAVALVTGANRGIGAAIVEALVRAGASRVYAAARNPAGLPTAGGRVVAIALDVTNPEQASQTAAACSDVQVLVNNAGIALGQPVLSAPDTAAAEREMRVNYLGTLNVSRAFVPVLQRNGGGAIVNIVSILGRVSLPRVASYSASKAALYSLTQGMRGELATRGTLVIGVMPGFVDTDMTKNVSAPKLSPHAVAESIMQALRQGIEDVYPGEAAEIAAALQRDPKGVERQFAKL